MDENLITLLDELSLRSTYSEDDIVATRDVGSNYASSSGISSPIYDQVSGDSTEEDLELKQAVYSLVNDLKPNPNDEEYDKSKLILALLGKIEFDRNFGLVTNAVKKIRRLVTLGKRMEQIYRCYYRDPNVILDLEEIGQLITEFSTLYESENYVREVNASRVYEAFHKKMILIYNSRLAQRYDNSTFEEDKMIT